MLFLVHAGPPSAVAVGTRPSVARGPPLPPTQGHQVLPAQRGRSRRFALPLNPLQLPLMVWGR